MFKIPFKKIDEYSSRYILIQHQKITSIYSFDKNIKMSVITDYIILMKKNSVVYNRLTNNMQKECQKNPCYCDQIQQYEKSKSEIP